MRFQEPVDPHQVSDQVREVMARKEFRYDKSLLDRIGDWISRQLDRLFGGVEGPAGGAAFGGGAGSLVAWLVIVVALVAIVATVVYVLRKRVRRPEPDEPVLDSEIEHRSPASRWRREAEHHEAAGEWKDALLARYRELVRTLVDRRQLPDVPGRTTGELRADLRRSTPEAAEPFDAATLLFELAWYADRPTAADENADFRRLAAEVLDRSPVDRFDAARAGSEVLV